MIAQLFRFVNPFAKFPAPEGGVFLFRWLAFDSDAVWRAGVSRKNVDRNALKVLLVGIIYKVFGKYLWCAESDLCKTEKIRGIFIAP